MSRSRAYRSMHLSDEARAEIARRCRAERAGALLAPLRAHLDGRIIALAPDVAFRHQDRLVRLVADAAGIAELRSVAIELNEVTAPLPADPLRADNGVGYGSDRRSALDMSGQSLPDPGSLFPGARPGPSKRAWAAEFDIERLRLEIDQLEQQAARLSLALPALEDLIARLDDADRSAASNLPIVTQRILDDVAAGVRDADELLIAAIVDAEVRAESVDLAAAVLVDMGYRVDSPTVTIDRTTLFASAGDGSTATITVISDSGGGVGVSSVFTDPGTAVPATHPQADELCERAVADQMTFTTRLASSRLGAGETSTDERPTRSALSDPATAGGQRRRPSARRNRRHTKGSNQ